MGKVVKQVSSPPVASEFVREAVARMRAAPRFLSQEEWDLLESYEGTVVSGDPSAAKSPQVSTFVREAAARMRAAPNFLSQEAWDDFASYDGPVVSGDPEGRVPDNLEEDDNE